MWRKPIAFVTSPAAASFFHRVRSVAEPQPKADILALSEELEREREDASRTFEGVRRRLREAGSDPRLREEPESPLAEELEELEGQIQSGSELGQRRPLDELVGELEEAGRSAAEAESRLSSGIQRLRDETAERLETESRRAEAAEARAEELRAALERERSTGAAWVKEAEEAAAEADERARAAERTAAEAEERASAAERTAAEAEEARLDREADARASAAAWLQGQARAIEAKSEKAARERISAARRDAVEKVSREAEARIERERERAALGAEERIKREVDRARREIASGAEPSRSEEDGSDLEREVVRYRELRNRIGTVRESAPRTRARAEAGEPATDERPAPPAEGPPVDVNEANFEQLRQAGLSVTQATKVIAYRQRREGFESVDELETIPGFPKSYLDELKRRLSA